MTLDKLKCFVGLHKMVCLETEYKKIFPDATFTFLAIDFREDSKKGTPSFQKSFGVRYCDNCGKAELYREDR